MFGLANLSNGIGRAFGIWLTPAAAFVLAARFDSPWNLVIGRALFQLCFWPTGYCYYRASKTTPGDAEQVRRTLALCAAKRG